MESTEEKKSNEIGRDEVIAMLKTCYDPEIPVDIWELGLIYEIQIFPVNNIFIQMTLTSPNCPAAQTLPADVERALKSIPNVGDVKLELTFDPPYATSMMSEAARLELGFM